MYFIMNHYSVSFALFAFDFFLFPSFSGVFHLFIRWFVSWIQMGKHEKFLLLNKSHCIELIECLQKKNSLLISFGQKPLLESVEKMQQQQQ